MSDEIYFGGVCYISASDAAQIRGFTRDYVARLCKDGKLPARRIGKQWYAQRDAFLAFVAEQEYARAKRRSDLIRERKHEYTSATLISPLRSAPPGSRRVGKTISARALPKATGFVQAALASAVRTPAAISAVRAASSTPIHAISLGKHMSVHTLPPMTDALHKLMAIMTALLFTIGTYLFVDAQYARLTHQSGVTERAALLASAIVDQSKQQLARASHNPLGFFSSGVDALARTVNQRVNLFVYGIMYPPSLTGFFGDPDVVSVRVAVAPPPAPSPVRSTALSPSRPSTPITQNNITQLARGEPVESVERVIERVIETQRIVASAGGLTEEILTRRLNALDTKLTAQIYSMSAQTPAIATTIVQQATAGATRIDELSKIALKDSTITGGSISGTSVSATTLSASGATTLAGTTVAGDLAVTGTISGTISSSNGTFGYITATSTTATSTFASGGLAIGTTSPSANSLFTVGTSSPLLYIDRITGRIGIGTSAPTSSAALQIDSTAGGFLPPRVTTAQKSAIGSPSSGL